MKKTFTQAETEYFDHNWITFGIVGCYVIYTGTIFLAGWILGSILG